MIDDEDAKIRRNLVTFSAAVLLFAWFDIPFTVVLSKLLGQELGHVSKFDTTAVCCVVFIYLGLRYMFSIEGINYEKEILNERSDRSRELLLQYMTDELRDYEQHHIAKSSIQVSVSDRLMAVITGQNVLKASQLKIKLLSSLNGSEVGFELGFLVDGQSRSQQGLRAKLPKWRARWIKFASVVFPLLLSASSIRYLVPVVIANIAVTTLVWRTFKDAF